MSEAHDRLVCILSGPDFDPEAFARLSGATLESPPSSLDAIPGATSREAPSTGKAARVTGDLEFDSDKMFRFLLANQDNLEQTGAVDIYVDWILDTAYRYTNVWISEEHIRTIAKLDIELCLSCVEDVPEEKSKPEMIR